MSGKNEATIVRNSIRVIVRKTFNIFLQTNALYYKTNNAILCIYHVMQDNQ